jgi:membrane protease YdiL (CAAX protease family)
VFSWLIVSAIILVIAVFSGHIGMFGFRKKNIIKGLGAGYPLFCIGICSLIASLLYINYIGFLKPYANIKYAWYIDSQDGLMRGLMYLGFQKPYFYYLGIYIIRLFGGALFEEVFMRGILLNILIKNCKKSKLFSITISACIFGILHLYNPVNGFEYLVFSISQVLYATILGFFLAVIYLKYNNIWSLIIMHFLFNCMGMVPFLVFSIIENFLKLHSIKIVAIGDVLIFIPILIYSLKLYKNMCKKRENGI